MELTAERLRELLTYDASTGAFTWRVPRGRTAKAGDVAGALQGRGYVIVQVDGRSYYAHRLARYFIFGRWPTEHVDHLNGRRDDNRWANLRECDRSTNMQNLRRARADNRTGLLGASPTGERWKAQIQVAGRGRYLGTFDTAEAAHAAYLEAKRRLHAGCTI